METAKKYGFAFATTDEKEVLADASTDLVVVTTRHDLHAAQVRSALASGKYVFTEKPLCIKEEELDEVKKSGEGEQRIMVGFNRRFSPHAKLIREYFAGRTRPLVLSYRVNAGEIPRDVWIQDPNVGGGRMIGEGCHFIDFMRSIVGAPIVSVQATSIKVDSAATVAEDSVSVNIRFADGSLGVLQYLALGDTMLPKERCEIFGENSTAVMDDFCTTVCTGKLGKKKLKGKQRKGFAEEVAAAVEAVRTGSPMPIPFAEIENVTRATFAVLRALKSGESEKV